MRDVLCEESQGKMFFGKRGGVIKRWMGRLQRGENEDFFLLHKWKTKASDYWNFKEFKELYALLSAALELHVLREKTFKVRGTVSPMRWEGETGSVIPVLWRVSAFLHVWGASLECPLHLIPFPIRNKTAFRSLHRSFSVRRMRRFLCVHIFCCVDLFKVLTGFMLKQQGGVLRFPTNLTKTINLPTCVAPLTIFPYAYHMQIERFRFYPTVFS